MNKSRYTFFRGSIEIQTFLFTTTSFSGKVMFQLVPQDHAPRETQSLTGCMVQGHSHLVTDNIRLPRWRTRGATTRTRTIAALKERIGRKCIESAVWILFKEPSGFRGQLFARRLLVVVADRKSVV